MSSPFSDVNPAGSHLGGVNVLFDLDGTLTDPFEGITACIQYALHRLGAFCPPQTELAFCIGPPLLGSFAKLLANERADAATPAEVEQAIALYRERFSSIGLFENSLYAGIPELLSALRERGARLYVATSKPHVFARQIVEHFGLNEHFHAVHGSELDGTRSEKSEVIGWLLAAEGLAPDSCLMVGDRHHDIHGAARHGIPAVGVLWGYGSEDELQGAGARAVCAAPPTLERALVQLAGGLAGGRTR